ncbi:MAG: LptA/OstA family protein [Betaproteobacteria bacterium]
MTALSDKAKLVFVAVLVGAAAMTLSTQGVWAAKEKVVVTADKRVTIDFDANVTVFEGNVKISYSDVVITADRAEVKGRKTATITGNVRLVQQDITLEGKVLTAYISEKRVVVEDGVTLTKKEATAGNGEVVVTCGRMELDTNTRGFVASGNVEMKRGDTLARGERATYTERDKVAILEGNVFAKGKNGETVNCARLLFRTDRDYIEALDKVTLEFEVEEEQGP